MNYGKIWSKWVLELHPIVNDVNLMVVMELVDNNLVDQEVMVVDRVVVDQAAVDLLVSLDPEVQAEEDVQMLEELDVATAKLRILAQKAQLDLPVNPDPKVSPVFLVKMVFPVKTPRMFTMNQLKVASIAQLDQSDHLELPEDPVFEECVDLKVFLASLDVMDSQDLLVRWVILELPEKMEIVEQLERKEKMLNNQLLVTDIVDFLESLDHKDLKVTAVLLEVLVKLAQLVNPVHKEPKEIQVSMEKKVAPEKKANTELMPLIAHALNVDVIVVLVEAVLDLAEYMVELLVINMPPLEALVVPVELVASVQAALEDSVQVAPVGLRVEPLVVVDMEDIDAL